MNILTLPNLITLCNLISGLVGFYFLTQHKPQWAAAMIFLALIFDFLDGFVARLFKSYSEIGKQLDSLVDMVSFGVLPSLLLFNLLADSQHFSACLVGLPVLFSALRLAKFNIDERQSDQFFGLPTPANAITVASFAFIPDFGTINIEFTDSFYKVYAVLISALLIVDYPLMALKFKNFNWKENSHRYIFLILSVLLLLCFKFTGIPIVLMLYLIISVITNLKTN